MDEVLTVAKLKEILSDMDDDRPISISYWNDEGDIEFIEVALSMVEKGYGLIIKID